MNEMMFDNNIFRLINQKGFGPGRQRELYFKAQKLSELCSIKSTRLYDGYFYKNTISYNFKGKFMFKTLSFCNHRTHDLKDNGF